MKKRTKVWPSVSVTTMVAFFLMFGVTPATPADSAMFVPFDIPGATETRGIGINPAGQVVGTYVESGTRHGFLLREGVFGLLSAGVYETIDIPGADSTFARGINPAGQVVGEYDVSGVLYGFLLTNGNLTVLNVPGADYTIATGINPAGDVVGFYGVSGTEHGFLWKQDSGFTDVDYPGAGLTNARGIDPDGNIVGLYYDAAWTNSYAFVRSYDGSYTTLDVPGAVWTSGNAINPAGRIVGDGWVPPPLGWYHTGFLLTEKGVSLFSVPEASETYPFGISPNGWIVGFYTLDGVKHGFLVHSSSLE